MLKKIKRELYYIGRVFNPKYSPASKLNFKYYFQYFKNRFFGDFLARKEKLVLFMPNDDFELHMLSQGGNLWMSICALKSFLYHSGLKPKIIIHSDGSIGEKQTAVLKQKFSGLEVIPRPKADDYINNLPNLSDKAKKLRSTNNKLLLKLIDLPLLAQSKRIMIMGDDVLFYSRPQELIDFAEGRSPYEVLASENHGQCELEVKQEYLLKHNLTERRADFINSDCLLFNKGCITVELINEYFENSLKDENFYLLEMAGLSCILAQSNFAFLPINKYHIKGPITENTVFKHFTSPRRQDFFAYGIDLARKKMKAGRLSNGK